MGAKDAKPPDLGAESPGGGPASGDCDLLEAVLRAPVGGVVVVEPVRDGAGDVRDLSFVYANDQAVDLLAGRYVRGGRLTALLPAGEASGVLPALRHAVDSGEPLDAEFDYADDGLQGTFRLRAARVDDRLVVGVEDVTRRRRSERESERAREELRRSADDRYAALSGAIDEGFTVIEMLFDREGRARDFVLLESNPKQEELTGLKDTAGKRASALLGSVPQEWLDRLGRVALTGGPVSFESTVPRLGRTFAVRASRLGGDDSRRLAVVSRDVTELRRAETSEQRQQLVLAGIGRILKAALASTTEQELGDVCLDVAEELTGSPVGFVGTIADDGLLHVVAVGDPGCERCGVRDHTGRTLPPDGLPLRGLYGEVLLKGEPLVSNDPARDPRSNGLPESHPPLTAFLGVPLLDGERAVGILAVGSAPGGYGRDEVAALEDIAPSVREAFERKRSAEALRRSDERNAFLVRLEDALRPVSDPEEVQLTACRLLGELLGASRVGVAEDLGDGRTIAVARNYTDGVPDLRGTYSYDDYGPELLREMTQGHTVVRPDIARDPSLTEAEKAAHAVLQLGATVNVPLLVDGRLVAVLFMHHREAHHWSAREVELLETVALRIWWAVQRARAESALRESEQRMRIAQEATGLGVYDWDVVADTADWDERARALFGMPPDERVSYSTFTASLHPDDRGRVTAAVARALDVFGAHSLALTFRVVDRGDGSVRWLRSAGHVTFEGQTAVRVVGAVEDVTDRVTAEETLRDSEDRQAFILALTDRLRTLTDEEDMLRTSADALADKLGVWRAGWALPAHGAGGGVEGREDPAPRVPAAVRAGAADDLRAFALKVEGEVFFDGAADASRDPTHTALPGVASGAFVPLVSDGRTLACLFAAHDGPHAWPERERRLMRDVAERVWPAVERARAELAVRREAARLRAVIDVVPVGFTFHGADGRLASSNREARRIWRGVAEAGPVDESLGYKGVWPGTGRPVEPQEWPAARALLDGTVTKNVVVDIERFDGTAGTIVLSAAPITLEGRTAGAVVGMQDITELRRAEQVMRLLTAEVRVLHEASVLDPSISLQQVTRAVAARARSLLESQGCSVYLMDEKGALRREILVGAPSARSGTSARRLVEEAVERALAATPGTEGADAHAGQGPGPHDAACLALPLVLRDDVLGAIALHFRPPRRFDAHYLRVARAFADQAALAIENARLRARVAESAAERERNRLARDLHDSVTQALFAASLKAEALGRVSDEVSPKTLEVIEEVRRLTRGALAQMRTMLLEMRGEPLSDVPLADLLRHLVEAAESRTHVDATLTVRGRADLPPGLHVALYRIAQEALNNIVRHARASRAWVVLELTQDSARLIVGDDGVGFDPTLRRASHLGLRTMQERACAAGAELHLITRVGGGTVVTVDWPGGRDRD